MKLLSEVCSCSASLDKDVLAEAISVEEADCSSVDADTVSISDDTDFP